MNKYRIGTDIPFRLSINDGGILLDWSTTTVRKVAMYSDDREAFAGACTHVVDGEDATLLDCIYPASEQLFTGALRVVVIFDSADKRTLTYDLADVFALVATSEEADSDGDTVTDATVTVSGLPVSTISLILNACIAATEAATVAEGLRQTAEAARVSAENARVEAEAARVAAENARQAAEAAREETLGEYAEVTAAALNTIHEMTSDLLLTVGNLQAKVATLSAEKASLTAQVTSLTAELETLQGTVADNEHVTSAALNKLND